MLTRHITKNKEKGVRMELRTLRYFIAVAQEGSLTNASKRLHITQPTLSRQLADLEDELGRQLFLRTRGGTELTEYGTVLLRYAQSITELVSKAEEDIKLPEHSVTGSVHVGAGETEAMSILAQAMLNTRNKYPGIDFQLHSGTSADLMDGLVRGEYDFLLECELQPHANLNVLELPFRDRWGALAPSDHPLAAKDSVQLEDLAPPSPHTLAPGAAGRISAALVRSPRRISGGRCDLWAPYECKVAGEKRFRHRIVIRGAHRLCCGNEPRGPVVRAARSARALKKRAALAKNDA